MGTVEYVVGFVVETSVRFAPLFFVSVGLAAIVKGLPIARVASRWLAQREHASVAAGSVLGTFSPFCSCTVVPVVRSLLVAGAPLAGVMAFWVASPLMDPEIFVLSVGLLGWDIAVARLVAALALALAAGYGAVIAVRRGWLPATVVEEPADATLEAPSFVEERSLVEARTGSAAVGAATAHVDLPVQVADGCTASGCSGSGSTLGSCGCDGGTDESCDADGCSIAGSAHDQPQGITATLRELDWTRVRTDFVAESWHIGRWILLAFALEALILRFVPQEAMVAVLGTDAPWAVPLAALLGIPLYMDSFSALPVISGLLQQGMAPGAAIAFLLAGPVTTIPAMTAVRAVLPGPVFRYYLATSLLGSMALGAAANLVL